jgi:hypothetical protein
VKAPELFSPMKKKGTDLPIMRLNLIIAPMAQLGARPTEDRVMFRFESEWVHRAGGAVTELRPPCKRETVGSIPTSGSEHP